MPSHLILVSNGDFVSNDIQRQLRGWGYSCGRYSFDLMDAVYVAGERYCDAVIVLWLLYNPETPKMRAQRIEDIRSYLLELIKLKNRNPVVLLSNISRAEQKGLFYPWLVDHFVSYFNMKEIIPCLKGGCVCGDLVYEPLHAV